MLRVAIVGCGKIADSHLAQIARIPNCKVVAVCDREMLMAQQLAERFGIEKCFADVEEILLPNRPDVVHITTPPQSHFALAKQCLEAGCHCYVEKPFTTDTSEAEELIDLAGSLGLKIIVGHDDQFSHVARRMRKLVKSGYLGGDPIHMESYYCYDLSEPSYAKALLGNQQHWVRQLPGGLLQNVISHGIARIAEFVSGEALTVTAHGFTSSALRQTGEDRIADELRVTICSGQNQTAYFTFSSQMRPSLHQFRIYGPKNGLIVDEDQQTVIRLRGRRLKSYAEKFVSPVGLAQQYVANVRKNVATFLARDFHMKSGMKFLIESFYKSITDDLPLPISYAEILTTSRIMDKIFEQITVGERVAVVGDMRVMETAVRD